MGGEGEVIDSVGTKDELELPCLLAQDTLCQLAGGALGIKRRRHKKNDDKE